MPLPRRLYRRGDLLDKDNDQGVLASPEGWELGSSGEEERKAEPAVGYQVLSDEA